MPAKLYCVKLTEAERNELKALIKRMNSRTELLSTIALNIGVYTYSICEIK
jgi:hypothetical protein